LIKSFLTLRPARGISSTVLATLMGHESSAITQRRYVHLFDEQRTVAAVREAMALSRPLLALRVP
jgi:integrase